MDLHEVIESDFRVVFRMWCGIEYFDEMEIVQVQKLATVADRFQITEVTDALQKALIGQLNDERCVELLTWSGVVGMSRLEKKARIMAVARFEAVIGRASFAKMEEQALARLLDDDRLNVTSEEAVWEGLVAWMKAEEPEEGKLRGLGLVSKIRFALMAEEYLRSRVVGMLPEEHAGLVAGPVEAALKAKMAKSDILIYVPQACEVKAFSPRAGMRTDPNQGLGRTLKGHTKTVQSLAEFEGCIYSGSLDGSIRVWNKGSMALEWTLIQDPQLPVHALAAWEGRMVSGHAQGEMRVWHIHSGMIQKLDILRCHYDHIHALAVCGSRLVSGSADRTIKLWAMSTGGPLVCERTLVGHASEVMSLAVWQDKVISGADGIGVWDAGTGACDATLMGHAGAVLALVVDGGVLLSASEDGFVRKWATGTWEALQEVRVHARSNQPYLQVRCLAVSGSRLVGGSSDRFRQLEGGVQVWSLQTLELEHTVRQPRGHAVRALLAAGGAGGVWAGVGVDVVAWRHVSVM